MFWRSHWWERESHALNPEFRSGSRVTTSSSRDSPGSEPTHPTKVIKCTVGPDTGNTLDWEREASQPLTSLHSHHNSDVVAGVFLGGNKCTPPSLHIEPAELGPLQPSPAPWETAWTLKGSRAQSWPGTGTCDLEWPWGTAIPALCGATEGERSQQHHPGLK